DREAARAALARVGLDGFGGRSFAALSGGQRQRVAVAQALVSDPELLLLDEPTANVDSKTEVELHGLFAELAGRATVVIVSHNLSVVAARATHLLCVNRTADLHRLGSDGEARLEPLAALGGALAFVHTLHPDHVKALRAALDSPHHGEH
ncbi:MAG: ATP-binding cassette domain-containing protein, partial [Kiritimatiellae bacterium]|nr:ATP-binding cassette domain-containing protein [Kiritimatiellia bacterium]